VIFELKNIMGEIKRQIEQQGMGRVMIRRFAASIGKKVGTLGGGGKGGKNCPHKC
jgi:hypothetical protein